MEVVIMVLEKTVFTRVPSSYHRPAAVVSKEFCYSEHTDRAASLSIDDVRRVSAKLNTTPLYSSKASRAHSFWFKVLSDENVKAWQPGVLAGWVCDLFDNPAKYPPYVHQRIREIFGDAAEKRLAAHNARVKKQRIEAIRASRREYADYCKQRKMF